MQTLIMVAVVVRAEQPADPHCDESAFESNDVLMLLQSNMQIKIPGHSNNLEAKMLQQAGVDDDVTFNADFVSSKTSGVLPGYVHDKEGGSDKSNVWLKDAGKNGFAVGLAGIFVLLIASLPLALHLGGGRVTVTKTMIFEAVVLLIWLIGGLYVFTQVLLFQSPHFDGEIRTLTLVEAVYLFAQILTTVGYGDITPARPMGQVFVGFAVLLSILVIANLLYDLIRVFEERMSETVGKAVDTAEQALATSRCSTGRTVTESRGPSFQPVLLSVTGFGACVLAGTLFFHLYPGEEKTVFQGIYMSTITLSTVGFGAFTPVTEVGMAFAAFWMVIGVGALGSVVGSFTAYMIARKKFEAGHGEDEVSASLILKREYADRDGNVDQFGYLRFHLLKSNLMTKEEIDDVMKQFKGLDVERRGSLKAELILRQRQ